MSPPGCPLQAQIIGGQPLSNAGRLRANVTRRCSVCGFETKDAVCPRCNTILLKGKAICPKCGKIFNGWIASCDTCGTAMASEPKGVETKASATALASVPGISEARAKELAARGFREFSDIVQLALPPSAVAKGLHHAIARKILLSALSTKPEVREPEARCPTCGAPWLPDLDECFACGSIAEPSVDLDALEEKVREVTQEIVDLAGDPDFQGMPEDVRDELLRAFGGLDEAALLREDFHRQIDAWRKKGFDVRPLEKLLQEDVQRFQERSVRIVRAQLMKKAEHGRFRCPLCEVAVPADAMECENCGARFG